MQKKRCVTRFAALTLAGLLVFGTPAEALASGQTEPVGEMEMETAAAENPEEIAKPAEEEAAEETKSIGDTGALENSEEPGIVGGTEIAEEPESEEEPESAVTPEESGEPESAEGTESAGTHMPLIIAEVCLP